MKFQFEDIPTCQSKLIIRCNPSWFISRIAITKLGLYEHNVVNSITQLIEKYMNSGEMELNIRHYSVFSDTEISKLISQEETIQMISILNSVLFFSLINIDRNDSNFIYYCGSSINREIISSPKLSLDDIKTKVSSVARTFGSTMHAKYIDNIPSKTIIVWQ